MNQRYMVDVEMNRAFLRQVIRLMVLSAAIASCGGLILPTARCLAQDFGVADESDDSGDDFWDETTDTQVEFTDFSSSDFEDLPPAMQALALIVCVLCFLTILGIFIFILYLLYGFLKALPPEYRLMEPGMVWLLLIPCFNIIWNFFVYPRIARSYRNFFHAHGRADVRDCGEGIGLAYAICGVLISIPCVNYITGIFCAPAMLVLMILYLVRLHGLKNEIRSGKIAAIDQGQSPFST